MPPQPSFPVVGEKGGLPLLPTSLGAGLSLPQKARPWSLLQQGEPGRICLPRFVDLLSLAPDCQHLCIQLRVQGERQLPGPRAS